MFRNLFGKRLEVRHLVRVDVAHRRRGHPPKPPRRDAIPWSVGEARLIRHFPDKTPSARNSTPTLANRVIDLDQFASHFRPRAVYGDENSYPGMIYPCLAHFAC